MKALVHTKPYTLEWQDRPEPKIAADEVLVEIKAVGICGSDVHGFTGKTGRRIPPIVMGHEAAGVVAKAGRNVTGFGVGDRVTFDSTVYCNRCFYCLRGQINLCDNRRVLGVSCEEYRRDGALAEYVAIPEWILVPIPTDLSFTRAAMTEPASIAFHAVLRAHLHPHETVVVVGCGIIGLFVIQFARLAGCGCLFAIDTDPRKLEKALTMGADIVIDPGNQAFQNVVGEHTEGRGVSVGFDAVGLPASVNTAVGSVQKGGRLVLIGNWSPEIPLPLQVVVSREIDLLTSAGSGRVSVPEFPTCVEMIASGRIDVDSLISREAPLVEGEKWFQALLDAKDLLYKVILEP